MSRRPSKDSAEGGDARSSAPEPTERQYRLGAGGRPVSTASTPRSLSSGSSQQIAGPSYVTPEPSRDEQTSGVGPGQRHRVTSAGSNGRVVDGESRSAPQPSVSIASRPPTQTSNTNTKNPVESRENTITKNTLSNSTTDVLPAADSQGHRTCTNPPAAPSAGILPPVQPRANGQQRYSPASTTPASGSSTIQSATTTAAAANTAQATYGRTPSPPDHTPETDHNTVTDDRPADEVIRGMGSHFSGTQPPSQHRQPRK